MIFKDPWVLAFIPAFLILILIVRNQQKSPSFRIPSGRIVATIPKTWKVRFRHIPIVLRILAVILFGIALAGPRSVLEESVIKTEGIDIVLAIDASGSMAGEDFHLQGKRVNRLAIVKSVVNDFIDRRQSDSIGLVAFAGLAYTVCPLTGDYDWLKTNLERIELGLIKDGTAIGSAISSSVARLQHSKAKSKIIVLLTDGINNTGDVNPIEAARAAKTFGIKIYTIGAGTKGYVPYPGTDFFGRKIYQKVLVNIDEATLKEVADLTYGQYFRATDTESLNQIYEEIDKLEKTEIEELGYREYKELFSFVLMIGLITLLCEVFLARTLLLKVP